ncbi:MAG: hypothetical protein ACQER7_14705 [Bacteroidota bacterium]
MWQSIPSLVVNRDFLVSWKVAGAHAACQGGGYRVFTTEGVLQPAAVPGV